MSEHTKNDTDSPQPIQVVHEPGTTYSTTSSRTTTPQEPIRYLVKDDGERVGVVLSWKDYQELCAAQPSDPELLVGLDDAELEILAGSMLALRLQERLNHLLHLSREGSSNAEEQQELDRLLEQVDQMNVLKARAMYTLQQRQEITAG
jgi:hypothetical protein